MLSVPCFCTYMVYSFGPVPLSPALLAVLLLCQATLERGLGCGLLLSFLHQKGVTTKGRRSINLSFCQMPQGARLLAHLFLVLEYCHHSVEQRYSLVLGTQAYVLLLEIKRFDKIIRKYNSVPSLTRPSFSHRHARDMACLWAHLDHAPFYLCFSTWPDLRLEY